MRFCTRDSPSSAWLQTKASYLGVRASLVARKKRGVSSPEPVSEKDYIYFATKEQVGIAKGHKLLLGQMVPTMQIVATSRFRYLALLIPWTDAELNDLHPRLAAGPLSLCAAQPP